MTRIKGWADTREGWALTEDLPKMGGGRMHECGRMDGRIRYIDLLVCKQCFKTHHTTLIFII